MLDGLDRSRAVSQRGPAIGRLHFRDPGGHRRRVGQIDAPKDDALARGRPGAAGRDFGAAVEPHATDDRGTREDERHRQVDGIHARRCAHFHAGCL